MYIYIVCGTLFAYICCRTQMMKFRKIRLIFQRLTFAIVIRARMVPIVPSLGGNIYATACLDTPVSTVT